MQNLNEVLKEKFGDIEWHIKEVSESVAKYVCENEEVTSLLTENGQNIMHVAAYYDATAVMIALKDRKDLMEAVDADGNTPFHIAAGEKDSHVAWLLAWYGAAADVPNAAGVTPKDLIVKNSNIPVRKVLGGPRTDVGILNEKYGEATDRECFRLEAFRLILEELDITKPADQSQIHPLLAEKISGS